MVKLRDNNGRSLYFSNRKLYYSRIKRSLASIKGWATRKLIGRIRKQICYNSEYSVSLRLIQINGKATLKELENIFEEFMISEYNLSKILFTTKGLEEERISDDEDKGLKSGVIYIELNIRGHTTIITL